MLETDSYIGLMHTLFALEDMYRLKIEDPVAQGIAIGTSSHAVGTSKALEIGEVQGAMSGLSIGIAGAWTVLFALFLM